MGAPLLVSMSQIVDFMLAVGPARATEARSHGGQPFDLYADWKAVVCGRLGRGEPLGTAAEMWPGLESDPKRARRYPVLLDGMRRWLAATTDRVRPARREMTVALGNVRVRVTPEIVVETESGIVGPVKLYLRTAKLTTPRVQLLAALMVEALKASGEAPAVGVLDVARAQMHMGGTIKGLATAREVVRAEALAYAALRGER